MVLFPDAFKLTCATPIYKGSGKKSDLSKKSAVSKIPTVSKI